MGTPTQSTLATVLANLTELTTTPQTPEQDIRVGSIEDLAVRLSLLHKITALCKDLIELIDQKAADEMTAEEMNIPGVAYLIREAKESSSWVDDTARDKMFEDGIDAISRIVAVDRETGEILDNLVATSKETWRLVKEAFSIGADPKAAFRKVLRLDPKDYRNKVTTGYKIKVSEPRI